MEELFSILGYTEDDVSVMSFISVYMDNNIKGNNYNYNKVYRTQFFIELLKRIDNVIYRIFLCYMYLSFYNFNECELINIKSIKDQNKYYENKIKSLKEIIDHAKANILKYIDLSDFDLIPEFEDLTPSTIKTSSIYSMMGCYWIKIEIKFNAREDHSSLNNQQFVNLLEKKCYKNGKYNLLQLIEHGPVYNLISYCTKL